jgi:hypothetical protein
MLSIRGDDFIAHLAYLEKIASHADYTWSQYNATNCLERRTGYKEQKLKIWERERETRNIDVRLGTEDGRQVTKK